MGMSILEHFSTLEYSRIERGKERPLLDIVVLVICAIVSNAEGWAGIKLFSQARSGTSCAACSERNPSNSIKLTGAQFFATKNKTLDRD